MPNADAVAYNIAVFLLTLFVLESSADKFIAHTAIIAHRTGISETVISLVTAGAEWEEVGFVYSNLQVMLPNSCAGGYVLSPNFCVLAYRCHRIARSQSPVSGHG
jgi:hypothetical protein